MKRIALICGVSGQDGAYLSRFLIDNDYLVYGTSRDATMSSFANLAALQIDHLVRPISMALNDFRSVLQTISFVKPNEIYNFAGQSSVGLSFDQPVETFESISIGTLNLLEAIRFFNKEIRFYNAGSGECFGDTAGVPADELTAFRPRSPYAAAKSAAHWEVENYRDAYGLFACSGILFNHESPLRPERFVTRKIIAAACRIAQGSDEKLRLGNIEIWRDWGWAPDYVEAMWKMLQSDKPRDYVVATGRSYSLKNFVEMAFQTLNLDWQKHVDVDYTLFRPNELLFGSANPQKVKDDLGWVARHTMPDVVKLMIQAEMNKERGNVELWS